MRVIQMNSPLGAAILAAMLSDAGELPDGPCECPKCTAARAMHEAESTPEPAAESGLGGFGDALSALRAGFGVRRSGWNGKGLTVRMQRPDANSKMTLPYLYIEYPDDAANTPGARCPWLASQTDILAMDWEIA